MWSLVKDFVGKGDLSKIATPVQLLEPLSELQQRCEDLEYTELLDQASPEPVHVPRLDTPELGEAAEGMCCSKCSSWSHCLGCSTAAKSLSTLSRLGRQVA